MDTVTAAASQLAVFTALNSSGPKTYSHVFTGQNIDAPKGIALTAIYAVEIFDTKGGIAAMPTLTSLVESGKYKVPIRVEVLGKGFDAIEQGLISSRKESVAPST